MSSIYFVGLRASRVGCHFVVDFNTRIRTVLEAKQVKVLEYLLGCDANLAVSIRVSFLRCYNRFVRESPCFYCNHVIGNSVRRHLVVDQLGTQRERLARTIDFQGYSNQGISGGIVGSRGERANSADGRKDLVTRSTIDSITPSRRRY